MRKTRSKSVPKEGKELPKKAPEPKDVITIEEDIRNCDFGVVNFGNMNANVSESGGKVVVNIVQEENFEDGKGVPFACNKDINELRITRKKKILNKTQKDLSKEPEATIAKKTKATGIQE